MTVDLEIESRLPIEGSNSPDQPEEYFSTIQQMRFFVLYLS